MAPPLDAQTRFDIEQYIHSGYEVSEIVDRTGVSQQQLSRMRRNLIAFGSIVGPSLPQGRPRILDDEMETTLLAWLDEKPLSYLFEMVYFLFDTYDGLELSEKTVGNILRRCGWTRKKASHRALQRDQHARDLWKVKLCRWTAPQLIFLDETASYERTSDRKYGWSRLGAEAGVNTLFKRLKRWSVLPAYTVDGYIAWKTYHGSVNEVLFNDFVRNEVLPQCTLAVLGGPRSVIVLDNARIHHSAELRIMCEEAGVSLVYLPAYSPDYNPIETSFAVLKQWLKKHGHLVELYGPTQADFERFLNDAVLAQANRVDHRKLFRSAGIYCEG